MTEVRTDDVQVPAKYVSETGADLGRPAADFLIALGLLGSENQFKPEGLNELKEGATAISKIWVGVAGAAAAGGLLSALAAAFRNGDEPTRVALVAGGSFLAAVAVLAFALIIRTDVRARADSTVAQYRARANITLAFLAATTSAQDGQLEIKPASSLRSELIEAFGAFPKLSVKAKNHEKNLRITGIQRLPDGVLQVRLSDGDWVAVDEIEMFTTA